MRDWFRFSPADYVHHGGWRGLPGERPTEAEALEAIAHEIEGNGPRIISWNGDVWTLELIFDADGRLTADQLAVAPELAGLDPDEDAEAITRILPFAYLGAVERAQAIAETPIEAIYGSDPLEDESIIWLANGVNLHCQPGERQAMLRLISNADSAASRALIHRLHPRRR